MTKPEVLFKTTSGSRPVGSAAMATTKVVCALAAPASAANRIERIGSSRFMTWLSLEFEFIGRAGPNRRRPCRFAGGLKMPAVRPRKTLYEEIFASKVVCRQHSALIGSNKEENE